MKELFTIFVFSFLFTAVYAQETPLKGDTVDKEPDEIVDFPEVIPRFPGGVDSMWIFIEEHLEYPEEITEEHGKRKVYLSFIVSKEGVIKNIKVERSWGAAMDNAAKDVVEKMPKWIPARSNDKPVASRCRLPITFNWE